jgi:hypothetical protein
MPAGVTFEAEKLVLKDLVVVSVLFCSLGSEKRLLFGLLIIVVVHRHVFAFCISVHFTHYLYL